MPKRIDDVHVGDKCGKWTVLEETKPINPNNKERYFLCQCECGTIKPVRKFVLSKRLTDGCNKCKKSGRTKHGDARPGNVSRLYIVWQGMIKRCENPNHKNYGIYGGKGISVCNEWKNYETFRAWAYSHGYDENAPYGECTIDRIDGNGDYCPENCKFSNAYEQGRHKSNTVYATLGGVTRPVVEWCEITGARYNTVMVRISRGLTKEAALSKEYYDYINHLSTSGGKQ